MSLTKVPKSMLLSSNGGGDINFITNSDGSDGVVGYVEGSYSAAAKPTGSFTASSGSSAFEVSTTSLNPLGIAATSLTFTKYAGASRQGRAIEYEFDLPLGYRAKPLVIQNQYIINSGTFVAGDSSTNSSMIFYTAFYDGSTWTVEEPSSFKLLSNSTTNSDVFSASVQSPYNATKMKLIAYVSETASSSWEVKVNLSVSPSNYVYGTPFTDWQSFTPTGTWVTNTTYVGRYRRVGDSMEISASVALTGAPTGNFTLNVPATIDTAKIAKTQFMAVGDAYGTSGGSATNRLGTVYVDSSTVLKIVTDSGGQWSASSPGTFSSGDFITLNALIPIVGWSSSVQMSDQTDTRVIAARYTSASSAAVPTSATKFVWTTLGFDKTGNSMNTSTGDYEIQVPGVYKISSKIGVNAATINAYVTTIRNNGSTISSWTLPQMVAGSFDSIALATTLTELKSRDVISVYFHQATSGATGSANHEFLIERISGPSAIAARDLIAASVGYLASPTGSLGASYNTVIFGTKDIDTHGFYNTSTGEFSPDVSGLFEIAANLNIQAALTSGQFILVRVGNLTTNKFFYGSFKATASLTSDFNAFATGIVKVNAGDKLVIQSYSNGSSLSFSGTTAGNSFSIKRVGN